MYLIIGLGNPGLKYRKTRHNIGFIFLDYFQTQNNFPRFKQNKIAKAEITTGSINDEVIFLAKPQTHMNNSGFAVKFLTKENGFKAPSALQACKALGAFHSHLIVVHDDFDLPLGEVRVSQNSSSGGHKGVGSIIQHLKTQNFTRVRIGIKPILNGKSDSLKAEDIVLKNFNKQEQKLLPAIFQQAQEKIKETIKNPFGQTTNPPGLWHILPKTIAS